MELTIPKLKFQDLVTPKYFSCYDYIMTEFWVKTVAAHSWDLNSKENGGHIPSHRGLLHADRQLLHDLQQVQSSGECVLVRDASQSWWESWLP